MAKIRLLATDGSYQWFECTDYLTQEGYLTKFEFRDVSGEHTYLWVENGIAASLGKIGAGMGGGSLFGPWGMAIGAAVGFLKDLYDREKNPTGYYNPFTGKRMPGIDYKISTSNSSIFIR